MKSNSNLALGGLSVINSQIIQKSSIPTDGTKTTFKEVFEVFSNPLRYSFDNYKLGDDLKFAEQEFTNIQKKIQRKELNRKKIWEQKKETYEEKDINIRNKISELKKKCRENMGFADVDVQSSKFLNKIDMTAILNTKKLFNEKAYQQVTPANNKESIFNFVSDNREISLKNFLLGLLKEERELINSKELLVSKTLKDSEIKMEKDYKNFVDFVEEEKKIQKANEQKIIEFYNNNRELAVAKKKLIQENKSIMDELDRTAKSINNLKSNAAFVHLVLGDKSNRFKVEGKLLDTKNSDFFEGPVKDKDLEKTVDNMIEEFNNIDLDKKDEFTELLNDYSTMTMKFQEFEENILKLMENKQTIEKEGDKMVTENQMELSKLKETEEMMKLEFSKLSHEREKDEKILNELKRNANCYVMNGDIIRMVHELYLSTLYYDEPESSSYKKLKNKKESEMIFEIMENLRRTEFLVIDYIDKLDKVSKIDEAKFRAIVHSRKEDNKKIKQQAQKIKSEDLANFKKEKAEERMHRIIIKGKKLFEPRLVGLGSKKKVVKENNNIENDEYNMLLYDHTDS